MGSERDVVLASDASLDIKLWLPKRDARWGWSRLEGRDSEEWDDWRNRVLGSRAIFQGALSDDVLCS